MTESQVVNEWIRQGEMRGRLTVFRQDLPMLLQERFPAETTPEIIQFINQEENLLLLHEWFHSALRVSTFAEFLAVFRR